MDVNEWLQRAGFQQFQALFEENGIDMEVLVELSNDDLKDIGISRLGDRKKILMAAARLTDGSAAPASDETPSVASDQAAAGDRAATPGPAAAADAENRQLSVMFCDLVGSTELSTRVDAEELREIINRFQHTCTAIAEQTGGFVARYSGDGILVYFGYPRANEDDPERAVNCGLAIARAMPALNAEVRVGIATGRVIVGDLLGSGPAEERTVVGETPNLAARLQGLAQANCVVVSETTRQLAGGLFDFTDLGQHPVKGFAEPVTVWQVTGESTVDSRFEARSQTRHVELIGRDSELMLLTNKWKEAVEGEGQTVFISGDAGIGKSRLIDAMRVQAMLSEPVIIRYQCSPHHASSALYPVIRQFQHASGIQHSDEPHQKLDKLASMLAQSSGTTEASEIRLLARLLSLDFEARYGALSGTPEQIKSQTLELLVEQLLRIALRAPLLFLFEDAHWIDPTTLALLEATMQRIQDSRILLVVTHRPEWQPVYSGVTTLQLNRLGKAKSAELIRSIVGEFPSNPMIEKIVKRADGIPLFLEELTKSIVEHALEIDNAEIPQTLQASLLARIDRLQPAARELAQTAATIGREFERSLLLRATEHNDAAVERELQRLLQAELIINTGPISSNRFLFKHALVQEAVYDTMLRQTRKQLHSRIADALAGAPNEVDAAAAETLARHYHEADRIDEAVACWQQAGLHYAAQSANAEAVDQFEKGIAALSQRDDSTASTRQQLDLSIAMTGPLVASRGFTAQTTADHINRSLQLARSTGKTKAIYPILYGRYIAHCLGGKVSIACQFADELSELATEEDIAELRILGERIKGQSYLLAARTDEALHSLQLAEHIELPAEKIYPPFHFGQDIQSGLQVYLAWTYAYLGQIDNALHHAQIALLRARELQHANTTGFVLIHNALVYGWLGLFDQLDATYREWQELDAREQVPVWRPFFLLVDVCRDCKQQNWQRVERTMDAIRSDYIEKIKLRAFLNEVYARAAETQLNLQQFDNAEALIDQASRSARESGEYFFFPDVLRIKAQLISQQSTDLQAIEKAWSDAFDSARETSAILLELQIASDYARYLLADNRGDEAVATLHSAIDKLPGKPDIPAYRSAVQLLQSLP